MAGACVTDTPTVELLVVGTPGSLEANVRNADTTASGTQGDDTTHVVTDTGVNHIQTQTETISNPGTKAASGIVVAAINPIWCGQSDGPISLLWEASLTIAGVLADQRDTITTAMLTGEIRTFSPGCLVGQITVPAGGSVAVIWEVRIKNDGASAQWSFRFGGSKIVTSLGY